MSKNAAGSQTALVTADPVSVFVTGQLITVDGGLAAISPLNPGFF